jgi:hypothetical protein
MLWRSDATKEWQICDSLKILTTGSSTDKIGRITVYNIQKGQYAMGIFDHSRADTSTYHKNCIELGFQDPKALPEIEIYPNPAGDFFFLNLRNAGKHLQLCIFDMQGKKIMQRDCDNAGELKISCKGWNSGAYVIQINDLESGYSKSKKLIIPQ